MNNFVYAKKYSCLLTTKYFFSASIFTKEPFFCYQQHNYFNQCFSVCSIMGINATFPLSYVLKITDRSKSYDFFVKRLGMKILRHTEQQRKCVGETNGIFDSPWSKTVIGFENQKDNFSLDLIYNYKVEKFVHSNTFGGAYIANEELYQKVKYQSDIQMLPNKKIKLLDPDGHLFYISNENSINTIYQVEMKTKDITRTVEFWYKMLGAKMVEDCGVGGPVKMAFSDRQCLIKFGLLPDHVDLKRGNGYGRINFIRPTFQLQEVEKKICETDPDFIYKSALCTEDGYHILVLEDPNNHEIAFIGGEKYLSHHSTPDPAAEQKLLKAIKQEKDS